MPEHLSSSLSTFSALDWCLLLFLFLSTVTAFRRGIVRVVFSILGLVAGLLIASWNYLRVATALHPWVTNASIAQVIAFTLLMFGVIIVVSVVAGLFRKSIAAVGLGFFDRILGAVFGFVRGVFLAAAVVMALVAFVPNAEWLQQSRLTSYFLQAAHGLSFVVPQYLQEQLAAGTAHLLQQSPKP